MKKFYGKNAVVTGSTSGIGLEIAKKLAKEGFGIAINGFGDSQEILNLQSKMQSDYGVNVIYENADMRDAYAIELMIENVNKKLGSIDVLVNNAGVQYVAPVEEFPNEKWNDIININLSAAFYSIKSSIPFMKKNNWGRIVNISSTHGLVASPNKVAYVAAKHGLLGLTKCIALELANTEITCNAICPGLVYTPLVEKQINDNAKKSGISVKQAEVEMLAEKHPMQKFVSSEEIGKTVLYLCSVSSMTGSVTSIDCGWTAQ